MAGNGGPLDLLDLSTQWHSLSSTWMADTRSMAIFLSFLFTFFFMWNQAVSSTMTIPTARKNHAHRACHACAPAISHTMHHVCFFWFERDVFPMQQTACTRSHTHIVKHSPRPISTRAQLFDLIVHPGGVAGVCTIQGHGIQEPEGGVRARFVCFIFDPLHGSPPAFPPLHQSCPFSARSLSREAQSIENLEFKAQAEPRPVDRPHDASWTSFPDGFLSR